MTESDGFDSSALDAADWRAIFLAVGSPAVILDRSHRVIAANLAVQQKSGQTEAELCGQKCFQIFHDKKSKAPAHGCPMEKMIASGRLETVEMEMEVFGGTYLVSCTPVLDEHGQIQKVIHIATDVTEIKSLQQRVLQSEKMEMVGRLTAGIAHDFNNLLTAILGFAEFVREALGAADPLRDDVNQIIAAGDRGSDLVRKMLAFSSPGTLKIEPIDLSTLVAQLVPMLDRLLGGRIDLRVECPTKPCSVLIDRVHLEQMIINLCVNAHDAMPDGGILTLETDLVEIGESDQLELASGRYCRITVQDTGSGMSTEVLKHLFEPFFTTKDPTKGTGLGLATVHGIVQQHGGHIQAQSEREKGSVFTIYLPQTLPSYEMTPPADTPQVQPVQTSCIILVADDEPMIRSMVARILERAGYRVLVAKDGNEALVLFEANRDEIQGVILDVMMPGLSGHQVARRIRDQGCDLPILLISGYDPQLGQQEPLEQPSSFLAKPFAQVELLKAIAALMTHTTES